jgi:hypothetical protein
MLDAKTGKPRTIIDIEKALQLTVSDESRDGLRIRAYRESPDNRSSTAEDDIVHSYPRRQTTLHESWTGRSLAAKSG